MRLERENLDKVELRGCLKIRHPERSEGSLSCSNQILRSAQNDNSVAFVNFQTGSQRHRSEQ
jgi:hypothetical protein